MGQLTLQSQKDGAKSEVWNHFKLVVDGKKVCGGFVGCSNSGTLLRYDCKVNGTSTLNRHLKACKTAKNDGSQSSMTSFVNVNKVPLRLKQAIMCPVLL